MNIPNLYWEILSKVVDDYKITPMTTFLPVK